MALRYALCMLLLTVTASAAWKRYLHTIDGGDRTDSPAVRNLSYFQVDPCSRTGRNGQVLTSCNVQPDAAELEHRLKTKTEVRVVGQIGSMTLYDIDYYFRGIGLDDRPAMRSV